MRSLGRGTCSEYWDWRAEKHDQSQWSGSGEVQQAVVAAVLSAVPPGASVVDAGCGTGRLSRALAEAGLLVTGIDSSPGMVRKAIATNSVAGRTTYLRADARDIPMPSESVDAVLQSLVLHNIVPDWRSAIWESWRVLRVGGSLVIVESFPPTAPACRRFFMTCTGLVHQRSHFTRAELLGALEETGLSVTSSLQVAIRDFSIDRWAKCVARDARTRVRLLELYQGVPPECREEFGLRQTAADVTITLRHELFSCLKIPATG